MPEKREKAQKPLQFGLKWLFALPGAAGLLVVLYSAGLPSEVLFVLIACPLIIALWVAISPLVARFVTDLFD
jgi:hypothetical protein